MVRVRQSDPDRVGGTAMGYVKDKIREAKAQRLVIEQDLIEAIAQGCAAGLGNNPDPMVVVDSATGQRWDVSGGACGFAWVNVPLNTALGKAILRNYEGARGGIFSAHKAYGGGVDLWVSGFGQSLSRKEAAAGAVARYLTSKGYKGVGFRSRMD
jgi:hypothetical protein